MRIIKIGFYKKSKSFFAKVIRFQQKTLQGYDWSHSQYSHVELVFCSLKKEEKERIIKNGLRQDIEYTISETKKSKIKNKQVYYPHDMKSDNVFFSSSECDGGTRFKVIEAKKENWDFIQIEVTEEQYDIMLNTAIYYNKLDYGWAGIFFAQFLGRNLSKKNTFFCSQIVSVILSAGLSNEFCNIFYKKYTHFINPAKLHRRIFIYLLSGELKGEFKM